MPMNPLPLIVIFLPDVAVGASISDPSLRITLRKQLVSLWGIADNGDNQMWADNGWMRVQTPGGVTGYAYIVTALQAHGDTAENLAAWRMQLEAYGGAIWTDIYDWHESGLQEVET